MTKAYLNVIALSLLSLCTGCGGGGGSSQGASTSGTLVGTWGGTESGNTAQPATLEVTMAGGTLGLSCGAAGTVSQALTLDANGHFSVMGTYNGMIVVPSPIIVAVTYSGTVRGTQMTLTVTNSKTQGEIGTYTLVKGQTAPPFSGGCPG